MMINREKASVKLVDWAFRDIRPLFTDCVLYVQFNIRPEDLDAFEEPIKRKFFETFNKHSASLQIDWETFEEGYSLLACGGLYLMLFFVADTWMDAELDRDRLLTRAIIERVANYITRRPEVEKTLDRFLAKEDK